MGKVYSRKATFVATVTKQGRIFRPVNKRAKTVVRRLGKRTQVTAEQLRASKGQGSYKFYQYTDSGLKAIR